MKISPDRQQVQALINDPDRYVCTQIPETTRNGPQATSTIGVLSLQSRKTENLTHKLDFRHGVLGNPFCYRQDPEGGNLFRLPRQNHRHFAMQQKNVAKNEQILLISYVLCCIAANLARLNS
jgi:hypothetical protein